MSAKVDEILTTRYGRYFKEIAEKIEAPDTKLDALADWWMSEGAKEYYRLKSESNDFNFDKTMEDLAKQAKEAIK